MTEADVYRHVQRWTVLAGVLVLAAILVLFMLALGQRSDLQAQADRNSTALLALCAQRGDLDIRIARTQKLLDETRGQRLVFAIPRQLFVDGQRQNRVTRRNLDILDCQED